MTTESHEIESVDPAPNPRGPVNYWLIVGGGLVLVIPQMLLTIVRVQALFSDLTPDQVESARRELALTFVGIGATVLVLVIVLVVLRRRGARAMLSNLGVDARDVIVVTPIASTRDVLGYWFDSGREGPFRVHGALSLHAGYVVDASSRDLRLLDATRPRDDGRALKLVVDKSEILAIEAREISSTLISGPGVRVEARGGQSLDFVVGREVPTRGATLDDAERLAARLRAALNLVQPDVDRAG